MRVDLLFQTHLAPLDRYPMSRVLVIVPVKNEQVPRITNYDVLAIDSGTKMGYDGPNVTRVKIDVSIPDAVLYGIDYAVLYDYDTVVFVDGGNRYPQTDIVRVVANLDYCDVAIGSRFLSESANDEVFSRNAIRHFLRGAFNWLLRERLVTPIKDWTHAFRAYRLETLLNLRTEIRSCGFNTGQGIHLWLLVKMVLLNKHIHEVPIDYTKSIGKIKKEKIFEVLRVMEYAYLSNPLS